MKFTTSSIVLASLALSSSSLGAPTGAGTAKTSPNPNTDDYMLASPLTPSQAHTGPSSKLGSPAVLTAGSRRSLSRKRKEKRQTQQNFPPVFSSPTSNNSPGVQNVATSGLGLGLVNDVLQPLEEHAPPSLASILGSLPPDQASQLAALIPQQSASGLGGYSPTHLPIGAITNEPGFVTIPNGQALSQFPWPLPPAQFPSPAQFPQISPQFPSQYSQFPSQYSQSPPQFTQYPPFRNIPVFPQGFPQAANGGLAWPEGMRPFSSGQQVQSPGLGSTGTLHSTVPFDARFPGFVEEAVEQFHPISQNRGGFPDPLAALSYPAVPPNTPNTGHGLQGGLTPVASPAIPPAPPTTPELPNPQPTSSQLLPPSPLPTHLNPSSSPLPTPLNVATAPTNSPDQRPPLFKPAGDEPVMEHLAVSPTTELSTSPSTTQQSLSGTPTSTGAVTSVAASMDSSKPTSITPNTQASQTDNPTNSTSSSFVPSPSAPAPSA